MNSHLNWFTLYISIKNRPKQCLPKSIQIDWQEESCAIFQVISIYAMEKLIVQANSDFKEYFGHIRTGDLESVVD